MLRTVYLKSLRDRLLGVRVAVVALFLTGLDGAVGVLRRGRRGHVLRVHAGRLRRPARHHPRLRHRGPHDVDDVRLHGRLRAWRPRGVDGRLRHRGRGARRHHECARDGAALSRRACTRRRPLAYLTLIIGGSAAASASYWLAAKLVGADISSLNLAAATLHLTTVLLVYGVLAFAVGAANREPGHGVGHRNGAADRLVPGRRTVAHVGRRLGRRRQDLPLVLHRRIVTPGKWRELACRLAVLTAVWAVLLDRRRGRVHAP